MRQVRIVDGEVITVPDTPEPVVTHRYHAPGGGGFFTGTEREFRSLMFTLTDPAGSGNGMLTNITQGP